MARKGNDSQQTQAGLVIGSPGYMSPEQAAGESVSPASDIYSLGVTQYEMLAGQLPFTGETTQVLLKHISQTPPKLQALKLGIPEHLCDLVDNILAKSPAQRQASMLQDLIAMRL